MPSCTLRSLPPTHSHHTARSAKQTAQIVPPQPISSLIKATFVPQMIAVGQGSSESSVMDIGIEWGRLMKERRRQRRSMRRKKRKKSLGLGDDTEEGDKDEKWLFGSDRSRNLTRKQEAALSRYIKEESAMLAVENDKIKESVSIGFGSIDTSYVQPQPESNRNRNRNRQKIILRARASEERIMMNYIRLVKSIAAGYEGNGGLSFEDLVQEGCVGLLRGVKKFDHRKGNKLSTYVYWWIKQAIVRAVANKSRLIRLPVNLFEGTGKVREANLILRSKLGRTPVHAEIAEFVNLSVSSVKLILQSDRKPISLDQPSQQDGVKLHDVLSGPDELRPDTMFNKELKAQNLFKILSTLTEREEIVIRLRYGLNGETKHSFDEIGRLINLSKERIRQIHAIAMNRLREKKKGLIECLDLQCSLQ